jgi:hypothetical protein
MAARRSAKRGRTRISPNHPGPGVLAQAANRPACAKKTRTSTEPSRKGSVRTRLPIKWRTAQPLRSDTASGTTQSCKSSPWAATRRILLERKRAVGWSLSTKVRSSNCAMHPREVLCAGAIAVAADPGCCPASDRTCSRILASRRKPARPAWRRPASARPSWMWCW